MLGKLQGNNQEKSIQTSQLTIKGNIITWEGTMIQLSNISYVSLKQMIGIKFPIVSLLPALLGILLSQINALFSIILIVCSVIWIAVWYQDSEYQKSKVYLNLALNSGNVLSILFDDKKFLNEVLVVLEQIICDGGVGNTNINIDIKGNSFSGNAQVLDNFKVR